MLLKSQSLFLLLVLACYLVVPALTFSSRRDGRYPNVTRTGRQEKDSEEDDEDGDGESESEKTTKASESRQAVAAPASTAAKATSAPAVEYKPVQLDNFRTYLHDVSSDSIEIMDEKNAEISGFTYDGQGPAAWFVVGKGDNYREEFVTLDYTVIPDENGGCNQLGRYRSDTIKLTLPGDMKFSDYDYISVYCLRFNHNFGYVAIPDEMKLRADVKAEGVEDCPQDLGSSEDSGSSGGSSGASRGPPPSTGSSSSSSSSSGGGGLLSALGSLLGKK